MSNSSTQDSPAVAQTAMSSTDNDAVRSMTGQGHASVQGEQGTFRVEVRTVNNRGLKCNLRTSDSLSAFHPRIESLVRSMIHRGSVSVNVSWRKVAGNALPSIDRDLLAAYALMLSEVQKDLPEGAPMTIELGALVQLPGVIASSHEERREDDELWGEVKTAIESAFANLNEMRQTEGQNMAESLRLDASQIRTCLTTIEEVAPRVAENYAARLESKIKRVLQERDIDSQPLDLLREVQIYADRSDISEEITRLNSHLQMFADVLEGQVSQGKSGEPTGRKLDFIIQEMFRETNTIGSKAGDADISVMVVEIKCAIERMRELVQNLE